MIVSKSSSRNCCWNSCWNFFRRYFNNFYRIPLLNFAGNAFGDFPMSLSRNFFKNKLSENPFKNFSRSSLRNFSRSSSNRYSRDTPLQIPLEIFPAAFSNVSLGGPTQHSLEISSGIWKFFGNSSRSIFKNSFRISYRESKETV